MPLGLPIVSVENLAASRSAADVTNGSSVALAAASGFEVASLIDGQLAPVWKSSGSAVVHTIVVDLGAPLAVRVVALFDIRPGVNGVVSVEVDTGADSGGDTGPWVDLGAMALGARGTTYDGAVADLAAPQDTQWVRIVVTLQANTTLEIGEIWAGDAVELPVGSTEIRREPVRNTAVNRSPGGVAWRTKRAEPVQAFELPLPPLSDADNDDVEEILDAAEGARNAVLLIPDGDDPGSVYQGTLEDSSPDAIQLGGHHYGRALVFTEDGRTLRG